MSDDLPAMPNVDPALFAVPVYGKLIPAAPSTHPPRFLLLYGYLRERSYSRLSVEEAGRLLRAMGGEIRILNPMGLPLADSAPETHSKVAELRVKASGFTLWRRSPKSYGIWPTSGSTAGRSRRD